MFADDQLTSLAFDLFQRYRLLRILGPLFAEGNSPPRLLDVGGVTPVLWRGFRSLAREMVPDSLSVVADIAPDPGLSDCIGATALQLPFRDESFDLVSGFDLLEHMPAADRPQALTEMLRVSRDGLLVAFPFDSPVNRTAEKMLTDYLRLHFQYSVPFLEEHREFGLPDRAGIERLLSKTRYPTASFDCGNTDVWLLMLMTQHSLNVTGCGLLLESLNRRFNLGPVDDDWAGPAYRAYFLLSKRNTAAALDAFRAMPKPTGAAVTVESMLPVCRLLLDIASRGRALAGREASAGHPELGGRTLNEELERMRKYVGAAVIALERDRFYAENVSARVENVARRLDDLSRQLPEMFRSLSRRVDDSARQIADVIHSRIWQTLCALGGLALRIGNGKRSADAKLRLTCEEPAAGDLKPRTGTIAVRGWTWPPSGTRAVHVRVDDLPAGEARIGLPSPEAQLAFPGALDAAHAGFCFELNTLPLSSGTHRLRIRAEGNNGEAPEIETRLLVEHNEAISGYDRWIEEIEKGGLPPIGTLEFQPLVSVLLPVARPVEAALRRAIASVRGQAYGNWELCIACFPESGRTDGLIAEHCREDVRIKFLRLERSGGPSELGNAALSAAGGEFVALLEESAELSGDALLRMVGALNENLEADLLYSDEDLIDGSGRRSEPFFKPDWSPDLLLSQNYIGGLLMARTALVRSAGGFRPEYDGCEDYDLVLRLARRARAIAHVPAVLYHRPARRAPSEQARRALEDHLRQEHIEARVQQGSAPGLWRVRYAIPPNSRVSILIPTAGKLDVLRANLDSLFEKTDYGDYEVVVIDNSRANAVQQYVQACGRNGRPIRWIDMRDWPFNYSALNNEAARQCDSPFLLFLNDDTEAVSRDWLTALVELGARPEVGAVGAKLLYPSGRIQHAGVVLGIYECCAHPFRNFDGSGRHYFDLPDAIRNVSAVTGACLLVPAEVFHEAGGFDEALFPVAFNDIDLCLRIGMKGYRVLYTPHALLYHRESYSKTARDMDAHPGEVLAMKDNWKKIIAHDPFYSPHLTRTAEDYSYRRRPA